MITQQKTNRPIPKRSSIAIFAFIILSTAVAMSCTDMQTENVFDEEELDLMTNIDRTGEQGFHEIIIYMSEEEQANRHESKLEQLRMLEPEHIEAIQVWKGDQAVEKFGSRGERGVIQVRTKLDAESYNNTLKALGMKTVTPESLTPQNSESSPQDDFYVVVEKMPELIGGLEQIMTQIQYPEEAKQAGIEGRVYVQFIVNKEGNVEDAKVIRGIGGGADEEALRVVKQAKFEPGYQRGEPVRVQYSLPIFFKLANNSQGTSSRSESENQEDGLTLTSYTSTEIGDIEVDYKSMEVDVSQSGNIIEGKVVDAETGVPLIGANIIIQGSNTGTSTDQNGRFTISTENADISNFLVSHIGYQTASYRL